ncbi:MAG: PAS domain S-box protein [Ignavibacteriales bacterium]|nr:PAS domain S-box protein [Ignavibacteriales bacterium]
MNKEQSIAPGILVVEDEKIVALDLKKRLELYNYRVLDMVDSAYAAIKKAEELRPDLILMDIVLNGKMDGIEAASIIRERFDIPFIFLTASSDEASLQRAKLSGPFGYIVKPFETRDLQSAVEIALYNSGVEKKLKESELWLNATLHSISDAVITTDMNKCIRFMNPSAERFLGVEQTQYKDLNIEAIYTTVEDASNELILTNINNLHGTNISVSKILQTKSGATYFIEESISLIKDRKDNAHGYVYSFRDVTQRRKAELAVLASRDFYLSLFEDFPTPVWRANAEGKFNYFNKTWLNFTGRSIEDEIFSGWIERVRESDKTKFMCSFTEALRAKSRFEVAFELLNKENEYRWIICIGTPLLGIDGSFNGFIGACIDISHMILAQNELMRAKNAAESANMAKARFISNMSHEVRTPLNGIIGILNLLLENETDKQQTEYVKMANNAAYTLLELLNNLLDFSKFEAKKDKAEFSEFALLDVVREILPPFMYQAKSKRLSLESYLDFDETLRVCSDGKKVQQILINLLSNAIKFTDTGKVTLKVLLEEKHNAARDGVIHVIVQDTGTGIASENQAKIFESFVQIDNSNTRKHGGAGLGLAIVKSITDALEGTIWVESEIGKGSTFHVILPCSRKRIYIQKKIETN